MHESRLASRRLPAIALLSPLLLVPAVTAQNQEPTPPGHQPQEPTFHYEPVPSRYIRLDPFDRYGRRRTWNPLTLSDGTGDYPIVGSAGLFDVYNTNKWKGDLPVIGENIFLAGEVISANLLEVRDKAGADDETEVRSTEFITAELFHGDTVFRPPTWRVRANFAVDFRDASETTDGFDNDAAVQELFAEALLWDLDPYLDFASLRVGRQAFASDFRNFVFVDNNDGVQLFGTLNESKVDYQIAFFDLVAKDPISNLNRGFEERNQTFFAANVFFEDVLAEGYKIEFTVQWAHDTNGFVDPVFLTGVDRDVDVYYLGFLGDGRIGGLEVAHAFYWMTGEDEQNQVASQDGTLALSDLGQDINAFMAALEVAVPDNWRRYVFSALYASGDDDLGDGKGEGFDSVFDNPNFAGGAFGFTHRQAIAAGNLGANGIGLFNTNSFYPNLRTKANDAPNSVNPGLVIVHGGCEADLSNYWSAFANVAYFHFAQTGALDDLAALGGNGSVSSSFGVDVSLAAEWRPFGVDNVIVTPGVQALFSTGGLEDLTGDSALAAVFLNAVIIL